MPERAAGEVPGVRATRKKCTDSEGPGSSHVLRALPEQPREMEKTPGSVSSQQEQSGRGVALPTDGGHV